MDNTRKLRSRSIRRIGPALLATAFAMTLGGCVEVKPEHITLNGETYIQGPATSSAPLPGLPDMGAHQLIPLTALAEQQQTRRIPVWGCTAFDYGTTAVGLIVGLAEANPLGALIVPIAYFANRAASKQAKNGDTTAAEVSSTVHCGAGVINLLALL